MHLNGLQGLDRLHPGDELVVMPLNFDLKHRRAGASG